MADVKLNPVFESFAKQIGDLVFYTYNGKTHVRRKGNPGNPKTPGQVIVRNSLVELVTDWSNTNGVLHEGWKQWAGKRKMKGNNAFVSQNFEKQRAGQPVELFKPVGDLKLLEFSATEGGSGSLECTFNIKGGGADKYLYIFTKKRTESFADGELVMHSVGEQPVSPCTVTGLEPGAGYCVYAAVTNGEYSAATEVSASIGVIARAGI